MMFKWISLAIMPNLLARHSNKRMFLDVIAAIGCVSVVSSELFGLVM